MQAILQHPPTHPVSLFNPYGPGLFVLLLCGAASAGFTYVLYRRYQVELEGLRLRRSRGVALALVCWAAIWFASYATAMLGYF